MHYFVYVHRSGGSVPHFEVLSDRDGEAARQGALNVLRRQETGYAAELWRGDELVEVLQAEAA
jgi:hypothetical protein